MNKQIISIAGVLTILSTLVFILLGKLDLSQFTVINSSVLGVLYGWYQRIEKEDIEEEHLFTLLDLEEKKKQYDILLHDSVVNQHLLNELHNSNKVLKDKLELDKDLVKDLVKPKRERKTKK